MKIFIKIYAALAFGVLIKQSYFNKTFEFGRMTALIPVSQFQLSTYNGFQQKLGGLPYRRDDRYSHKKDLLLLPIKKSFSKVSSECISKGVFSLEACSLSSMHTPTDINIFAYLKKVSG